MAAEILKREGRLAHVRMDDGVVRIIPDSIIPQGAVDKTLRPEREESDIEFALRKASERIKGRRVRIALPAPIELTSIGLFRISEISRLRKRRARREAKERMNARS
jgi:hypothetical protein